MATVGWRPSPSRPSPSCPEQARDDDGRWIGISGRQRVLVYNTDLVDPAELPDSVFDLIDDRWTGQIGVAGGNGSFQDFVTAMRATEGEDVAIQWLNDLAALDPVPYPKNSAIVAAVGRGEVELGLVNHYYNYLALEENPDQPSANHVFAAGDPGAIFIVTAAAIVDGTDRADVANRADRVPAQSGEPANPVRRRVRVPAHDRRRTLRWSCHRRTSPPSA